MRHTISILVENKFGVLTRIAGMFSGRGFNIDTLNVGPTLDATTSRMTIVVRGDDKVLEQVIKQLDKLVDVIDVQDFRDEEYVDRELVLLRVTATSKTRSEVMQICDIFRAKIIDVQAETLAIEVTGTDSKINKFLMLMDRFGIIELTRTGKVALPRTRKNYLTREPSHARQNLHRQRRRSLGSQRQNLRRARLRLAGPRPRAQSQGQRLQGHHRPLSRQQDPQGGQGIWLSSP